MKQATWSVTGICEWTMRPKTVTVKAASKEQAIDKGLKKIDTNRFIECRLIKA